MNQYQTIELVLSWRKAIRNAMDKYTRTKQIKYPSNLDCNLYISNKVILHNLYLIGFRTKQDAIREILGISNINLFTFEEHQTESETVCYIDEDNKIVLEVFPSPYTECRRCQQCKPEVGNNKYFPDLCCRCWTIICDEQESVLNGNMTIWPGLDYNELMEFGKI